MAQNTTLTIGPTWTLMTNADVTNITFQNDGFKLLVSGTETASAPSDDDGSLVYSDGEGEANAALSDLFPGITAVRVYGRSIYGTCRVMVSHA